MTSKWEFALVDEQGRTLDVAPTARDAFEAAGVRQNPYVDVPESILELDELAELPEKPGSGASAFRVSGLEQVSGHEVLELTEGLSNPDEVFKRLRPYFEHLKGQNWATPETMVKSFLGGNDKVNKEKEGLDGTIKGLTLVPFWRNLQDGAVRDAPLNKAILKQIDSAGVEIADAPKVGNWCVGSSWACRRACLIGVGNNYTQGSFKTKFAKCMALKQDPVAFCAALAMNCAIFGKKEKRAGRQAFVRLNMLSDIPWEVVFPDLFKIVPECLYYDYTKVDVSRRSIPKNYDLTFSYNGMNEGAVRRALEGGHRIAVVFVSADPRRTQPRTVKTVANWRLDYAEIAEMFGTTTRDPFGANVGEVPLVDGDSSDFRAVDPAPSIVALSYKSPGGVSPEARHKIRYESKFATVVPVKRLGDALVTAHTPLQVPFLPADTDKE